MAALVTRSTFRDIQRPYLSSFSACVLSYNSTTQPSLPRSLRLASHRSQVSKSKTLQSRPLSTTTRYSQQASRSPTSASSPAASVPKTPNASSTAAATAAAAATPSTEPQARTIPDLSSGFNDAPPPAAAAEGAVAASNPITTPDEISQPVIDWSRSFHGLSTEAFSAKAAAILQAPVEPADVEVKPDGILYLPEIKYRRILNRAFGPGGWGLAPRGETIVTAKAVTREYALVVLGRLVSVARGEQDYFSPDGIPTAAEGCKSNALTRCCKDLGIASELWDPQFIRSFTADKVKEVWVEHAVTKKKRKIFLRKDESARYPFKETK